MPKKPPAKIPGDVIDEDDDALTQRLADLALELAEQEDTDPAALAAKTAELNKMVRKSLLQKQDEVLYDAIERARDADLDACRLLRDAVEDAAQTVALPRGEAQAFAIPLFVRSTGGLHAQDDFQDQPAFEALTASFQSAALESPDARVVLINHAYHLDEIDSITYSHLNEIVREAATSMTDKKIIATPAIERSMSGWPERDFTPEDVAVELRFLLGFTLARRDDPFYSVPEEEAAANAWYTQRARRFEAWSGQVGPLVQRSLAPAGRELEVNFLYQDVFFGAKELGMAELFTLQMMAQLNQGLQNANVEPAQANAVITAAGPGAQVLRVELHGAAPARLLVAAEKPLDTLSDLQLQIDDMADALATLGIRNVRVAP